MAEEAEEPAGERTEAPTERRLRTAAEQGQVALSREAVSFAALLLAALAAAIATPVGVEALLAALRGTLARAHEVGAADAARHWLLLGVWLVLPVALAAALGAVAATLAQTRGVVSAKAMEPDLGKLSPIAGFGRVFGAESLLEFARTCVKVAVVGGALWIAAADLPALSAALAVPGGVLLGDIGRGALRLLAITLAVFALLAIADLLLVRMRHLTKLRMTREELKEELRESEGDPMVKGRLRQIREQRGRRRMLAAVPRAAVVITNPTHYAVALAYEPGQSAAPRLVAKGVDEMAARIREAARAAGVPITSDPPLARALHRLELDSEVPAEHWDAVARIIAFVLRRRGPAR